MNKKQKGKLRKAAKLNREPVAYTRAERNAKVTKILIQLMQIQMDHVLTDDIRKGLDEFIATGESYIYEHYLPQYSRVMQIHFVNDKNKDKENSINIVFNKIRIEGEGDENPINKLNALQEGMF